MITSSEAIIVAARNRLGRRWSHQGRSADGEDCVGVIVDSAREAGWEPRDPAAVAKVNYRTKDGVGALQQLLRTEGKELSWEELQPGDVILWFFEGMEYPQHVGLLTAVRPHYVLHADIRKGVVEQSLNGQLRQAFVAGYRFWDLCNE